MTCFQYLNRVWMKRFGTVMLVAIMLAVSACGPDADDSTTGDPALTGTVTINGIAIEGQTLTANIAGLGGSGGVISYQWKHSGTTNIGTNSNTYNVISDDVGSTITVTVTRSGYSGSVTSLATAIVTGSGGDPALTGTVTITGNATVGQTLTANIASLGGSGGVISYQWKRGGTTNIGTNSNTYNVVSDDVGSTITVTVMRSGYSGSVTSLATATVTDIVSDPSLTGTVTITGNATVGQMLTANIASLGGSGGVISYQWKRSGTTNIGTNSNTYNVASDDVGSTITVTVTRSGYSGSVTSLATATVTGSIEGGNSGLLGKWYAGIELYDFRPDGKLYILGSDHGVTYTVSGSTITTYVSGSQPRIATFSISGSGSSAILSITAPSSSDIYIGVNTGTYTRK